MDTAATSLKIELALYRLYRECSIQVFVRLHRVKFWYIGKQTYLLDEILHYCGTKVVIQCPFFWIIRVYPFCVGTVVKHLCDVISYCDAGSFNGGSVVLKALEHDAPDWINVSLVGKFWVLLDKVVCSVDDILHPVDMFLTEPHIHVNETL